MSSIFVGRQPIYDSKLNVVAYELLFRNAQGVAAISNPDEATCTVLTNVLLEIGIENVCGSRPAFVNFTRGFFDGKFPIPIDPKRLVIEVLETVRVDEDLVRSLNDLRTFGFQVALDDFVLTDDTRPLLKAADIVKLDILAQPFQQLWTLAKEIRRHGPIKLLAEKVETAEQFEACRDLEFDFYQGYFLSKPRLIEGQQVPRNKLAILELVAALQNPEIEFKALEALVCRDVALSVRLLQMVNSSSMGVARRVESIQKALVMLGTARVRNLTTLSLLSRVDDAPPALLGLALTRAKMCELLGERLKGAKDSYFTVGLLSTLDLFMQRPLDELLKTMPLSEDVVNALVDQEGGMGAALRCAQAYEQGQLDVGCLLLSRSAAWECYIEAVKAIEGPEGILCAAQAA